MMLGHVGVKKLGDRTAIEESSTGVATNSDLDKPGFGEGDGTRDARPHIGGVVRKMCRGAKTSVGTRTKSRGELKCERNGIGTHTKMKKETSILVGVGE